ncbi:MAG: TetR/AcrR family transcriptional regulator [Nevskiales bacterium]
MGALAVRTLRKTDLAATPRVGRPPRVSAQAIIAAAIELGLEDVTLRQVADRLGIGIATLYRHVSSRDEMVRLAAFQITLKRALPESGAAHWSELATRYAESLYESFLAEPQLIGELLKGRLGPHAEVDVLEQFLTAMSRHGFTTLASVQLFHAIGMVTIGAAAGQIGLQASEAAGTPWRNSIKRTLAERDADELPQVRRVLPATLEFQTIPWLPTLQKLLAGIAAARGETLPPNHESHERRAS